MERMPCTMSVRSAVFALIALPFASYRPESACMLLFVVTLRFIASCDALVDAFARLFPSYTPKGVPALIFSRNSASVGTSVW